MRLHPATAALLAALLPLSSAYAAPSKPAPPSRDEAAAQLVGGALSDGRAFAWLQELTDSVGPRLSGSPGAAAAVAWASARLRAEGVKVWTEKVMVPHWVRGEESAAIVKAPAPEGLGMESAAWPPAPYPLALTALGGSIGTPPEGIEAEVVEARTLAEAAALGERAKGRIVLFQHEMSVAADYGRFAELRTKGAVEAAKVGAVAALVRSLSTASLRTPHTGAMRAAPIPGAALAAEDAMLLHRLLQRGPVRLRLKLGCRSEPDAESANVVFEVRGREKPDELVLLGAHLDSWDLAQGAIDDGAGTVAIMEAVRLASKLRAPPRRTLRGVLFMNEENGLKGGDAYAKAHGGERHVAAMEVDSGPYRPLSVRVRSGGPGADLLRPWLAPLAGLGAAEVSDGEAGGADLSPLTELAPLPLVRVELDGARYFDLHHSAADTLDKVKPQDLAQLTAAVAWTAWSLAEHPDTLAPPARPAPPPPSAVPAGK